MADGSFVNQQDLWIEPPRLADEMDNEIDEIHSSDAQMEHIIDGEGVQMGEQVQSVDEYNTAFDH